MFQCLTPFPFNCLWLTNGYIFNWNPIMQHESKSWPLVYCTSQYESYTSQKASMIKKNIFSINTYSPSSLGLNSPPPPFSPAPSTPSTISSPMTTKSSLTTPKMLSFKPSLPFHMATSSWRNKVVHGGVKVNTRHTMTWLLSNTCLSLKKGRGGVSPTTYSRTTILL